MRYTTRKTVDIFEIGDSAVVVDTDGENSINRKEFRRSEGLCELLTREK